MTGVVGLIDRAATLLPGSELSAVLGAIPREKVPNARLVEVLQARLRQLSHDQAELFADMVEISHTLALEKLPDNHNEPVEVVARAEEQFEWASHEIAAALTWTPTASDRELALATALCERLPLVYESLHRGDIDRAKALVFVEYLDPANGDVTDEQARRLSERFVALAPGLTTKQLRDRLYRALEAIDPGIRRRRYVRAVQNRSVAVYLNPRTGTATLVGDGLPADEAAAAVTRLDRLTEATKRAGHPGTRHQISADLFLGMLNGDFHGLTEDEIIGLLLGRRRPEDNPHSDTTDTDTHDGSAAPDENGSGDRDAAVAEPADDTGPDATEIDDPVEPSTGAADDRWAGERVATREGIELRAGLGTAAGRDDHPTEIPGLGPVGAQVARDVIATHRRGARWVFALVDCDGYLLLAGSLRRRPRTGTPPRPVRGGTIELHLTLDELHRGPRDGRLARGVRRDRPRLGPPPRTRQAAGRQPRSAVRPRPAGRPRLRARPVLRGPGLYLLGAAFGSGPHPRSRLWWPDRAGQHRPGVPTPPPGQESRLDAEPAGTGAVPLGQPSRTGLLRTRRAHQPRPSRPRPRRPPGRGNHGRGR